MPGNRSAFNAAIKKGHNAAWDGQWKKAADEYRRALGEFPEEVSVRASLAHALEELGQWENAFHEYQQLAKMQPRDPVPVARMAVLLEKLKRPAEAAGAYLQVAELYLSTKLSAKAVEAWRRASELEPDRTDLHLKLAETYARGGQFAAAATEHIALARIYKKRGEDSKALNAARQAQTLDPRNSAARVMIEDAERMESAKSASLASPMGAAEKAALSRLAENLFEEPAAGPKDGADEQRHPTERPAISQIEVDALIAHAVDAQMHHRVGEAIEAYRKLLAAGIARPEVKFNLGLLYFETMRYDEAVAFLAETTTDHSLALASHYALGQCYRAQGKMDAAVEHFLQVVKIVDLGSVRREQADDLISVYEGLAESYAAKGDRAEAEKFSQALEDFLNSKGWEDKVQQVRRHLEALHTTDEQTSLAEVIEMPDSDKVLEALALSQEYMRREKLGAAAEECYHAIQLAPNYLPAHIRLAEIMVKQDRLEEASFKYQTLAELYMTRADLKRAETMYRHALAVMTDDVGMRSRLIDLLVQQARNEDALEQYLILGDTYARLGQAARANEKFTEGARLATRANITSPVALSLRHRWGETRLRQGDFKGALGIFQEIRQQSPDDERAHFYIVDLEFRLNQAPAALRDLEDLLTRYHDRREPQKVTAVLEALAQNYPSEQGLALRLADNYLALGAKDKAVTVLDGLGETLLSAGNKPAAAQVIRRIIELQPTQVEDYEKLLQDMGE